MAETLRIALAQMNPHVGALSGNADRIRRARAEAAAMGADLVVTPEFSIGGYPPEDLVRRPAFLADCAARIAELAAETADGGPGLVVGGPWFDGEAGKLHNALFVLDNGRVVGRRAKHELPPGRGAFDAGPAPGPVAFRGFRLGLMIGEDWWLPAVSETLAESGAEALVAITGDPFGAEKAAARVDHAVHRVVETGLALVVLNQVGGQDESVFDGASFALNPDRSLAVQMPMFEEATLLTEWRRDGGRLVCAPQRPLPPAAPRLEKIYRALVLRLRDRADKSGFSGVVMGLSGGVDSALTAAVAVDALGPDRVRAVTMPGPRASREGLEDAASCARLLGIRRDAVPVGPAMEAFGAMLAPLLGDRPPGAIEEGIQSRARALVLTALSDRFGDMLLATGNKSEMLVGRGDMHGGYPVLKDVYRTTVDQLCRWRNAHVPPGALGPQGPVVPGRVLATPSAAGAEPGQTDRGAPLPYGTLDAILAGLGEGEASVGALVADGHDRETVLRVQRMLDRAERERRRVPPPGMRIRPRAPGRNRRHPVTNGYTALMS